MRAWRRRVDAAAAAAAALAAGSQTLACRPARAPQIFKSVPLKRKEVEPVLGGEEEWKNAPRTDGALGWAAACRGGCRAQGRV